VKLRDTQQLLWRLITAPEGVAHALEENPADAAQLAASVVSGPAGTSELDAQRRLDVYAEAYFARIHDALASDFADLAAQLGEDTFHDLVTSYLAICPPRRPSLRDAGERLPDFLAHGEGGAPFRRRAPWAADLAKLEWLQADLFDAPDAAIATRHAFEALPAEAWPTLQIRLVPASALLDLDWPAHRLCASWPGADGGAAAASDLLPEPTRVLVWRDHETVSYRPVEESEALALAQVANGTQFAVVCEVAAASVAESEAAARAASWLARWLEDGLIAALDAC
jgi:hypothetical protein